jgi:ATP:ADP antiporter, AAA family
VPTRTAVTAATICSAAVSVHFVAGKATRDALFLASVDITSLPGIVAGTAALSIVLVALSSFALRRIQPETLIPALFTGNAVLLMVDWLLVDRFTVATAWAVYMQVAGLGPLLGSGFWLLASERFDPRTARRNYGQIAGVGTLAGLAGALAAERVGALYGIAAMLPLLAAVSVVCALSIRRFAPSTTQPRRRPEAMDEALELAPESPKSGLRALAKAPYLQNLAALVFLGTLAAAIADYVFKAAAVESFGRGETLLRFFAIYYAGVSLLAFVVQTTVSTMALDKLGLGVTASTPSLALAVGGLGGLLFPGLQGALMARVGESVFRGSLFKTGYEIFFTPIEPQDKRAAKSIIDVGFDRLGDAAGGAAVAALLAIPFGDPYWRLLLAAVGFSGAALFAASRLSRGYIATLEQSLVNRAIDFDLGDATDLTTRTSILRTLRAGGVSGISPASTLGPIPGESIADPEVQEILALRSRDVARIRPVLREGDGLPASLVPHVVPLLAWDPVADDAIRALKGVVEERVGQLIDALLDPNQPFAVRRRLARVFSVCVSQRAVDGVLLGLEDLRFEVRFHCGRSLAAIVERSAFVRVDMERVFNLVRRELAVGRPVWESQRLLDDVDDSRFVDGFLKQRAGQSLAHVFTLLSVVLPTVPLQIAYRGLHTDDQALRGTALEYLEGVLPRDIRDRLWPVLGDEPAAQAATARDRAQILADLVSSNESIMLNLQGLRHRLANPGKEDDA